MSRRLTTLLGLCLVVALATAGFVAVVAPREREDALREWRLRLASVAVDRAAAIDLWLSDGLDDVGLIASYPTVRFLAESRTSSSPPLPADEGSERHADELLREVAAAGNYVVVALVDEHGASVAAWPGGIQLDGSCAAVVAGAKATRRSVVAVCDKGNGRPLVLFLAPVAASGAWVVAVASPEDWLYPFVEGEPMPTSTSETVLMVRDRDDAVFIVPLRHLAGAPLSIRRPLSTPGFAAQAALSGVRSVAPYVDYRGVPVIAATRRLERSGWGLVVKVDEAEMMAPVKRQVAAEATALAGVLLALGIGSLALLRHFRGRRMRERLADLEQREVLREALATSEQRLRAFFDAGAVGMLFGDVYGNILDANDELLRIIGYSRAELQTGMVRWVDLTPPEFLSLDEEGIEEARRRGSCTPYEKQYIRKDGSRVWILVGFHLLGEAREESVAFIVDISKQKEAEAQRLALQTERDVLLARLERQISSLPIGLFTLAKDLTVIDVNPAAERMFGFSRAELVGGDLVGSVIPATGRTFMEGFLARLQESEEMREAVTDVRTKDGRVLTCHWHDTPLRDDNGELIGVLAMIEDISDRLRIESALRASEVRFRSAFENAAVGMALIDPEGRFVRVNQALCALLGRDRETLVGLPVADVSHPDEAALERESMQRQLAGDGATSCAERRLLRADGVTVWATVSDVLLREENGRPQFFIRHVQDITSRKQAEEALRRSEQKLLAVLDATPFPVAIVDIDDQEILYWSRSALEKFGHTAPTAPEWYRLAYPDPEYRRQVVERWKPFLEEARESNVPVNTGEYRVTCKDGSVRICELHATFSSEHLIVTFNDITDRKRAEEALRSSEALYHDLVETSQDLIWQCDSDGRYTYLNPAWEEVLGYRLDQMLGRRFSDFQPAETAARDRREFARLLAGGSVVGYESIHLAKDGHEVHLVFNAKMVVDGEGRPSGTQGTAYDITERKRAEEALAANEARYRELFASIQEGFAIHEIVLDDAGRPVNYRFIDINPAFTRLVGLGPEIVGRTVLEVLPGTEREWIERYGRVALTGEPCRFESYSGELEKYFEVNAFSPSHGKFATAFVDITARKRAEEALAANEERFRQLFESMSDGVAVYRAVGDGEDFVFTELNPAGERISTTTREQILGQKVTEVFPGIVEMGLLEVFSQVWRDGVARRHPVAMYKDERLSQWVENLVYRLPTGEIVAVYSDATERKRAQADLAESERALATLMSNLPGMAYRCANRPDWPMDLVSEGSLTLTGYTPAELQKGGVVSYGELIVPEDREVVWDEVQHAISEGEPFELNYRITTRDGGVRSVWERGRAIRGRDGRVRALEGFIADVTERRAAEEALRRERDRAQRYLDLAGVMFVALDRDGRITLVNPRACEVLEVEPDDILGHDWFAEFVPVEERTVVRRTFERLIAGEIELGEYFENQVLTLSGDTRVVAWHNTLLRDADGTPVGTLSSGDDVTEKRAAEQTLRELRLRLAEAEEAERRRLARELHDQVGQSLTALGINLSIVRQKIPSGTSADVSQRLEDSRSLVDEVVAQVRDVMAALRPSVLDDYGLAAALEWTASRFQERTGLLCNVVAGDDERRLPAPVETALFRIAQEALTNVARHAGRCSVEIALELTADLACLTVADDGGGYDAAAIPPGRMGLAGMRERAEAVGGRLEVTATLGSGVVVVAEVPLESS